MSETGVISGSQRLAIDALLNGASRAEAAKQAKVGPRTLFRWLREPEFAAALGEAQSAALDRTSAILVRASLSAVALLAKTIANEDAPLALRLNAARTCLDGVLRWQELRDVERRLAALENRT